MRKKRKRSVPPAVAAFILFFCGLPWAFAAGQAETCRDCHKAETGSFELTAHAKEKSCDTCHGDAAAHLSPGKKGAIFNPGSFAKHKADGVCLSCHAGKKRDAEESFKAAPSSHDDLRCFDCHLVHAKKSTYEDSFRADLTVNCADCHREQSNHLAESPHGAAGLKCADCHKFHETKTISQDIEEEIHRCLSCHAAQELEFKQPFNHPLRERQIKCSACHEPHSGRFDKMLKRSGDEACEECHMDIVIENGKHPTSRSTNHPFKVVKCMDCHTPHGSVFRKILKHDGDTLCHTCHN